VHARSHAPPTPPPAEAAPAPGPPTTPKSWAYPQTDDGRDLRFDFLRGAVLFVMTVVHLEIFSLLDLVVWERVGIVSGAEGFVILSGVVVGMVYGRKTVNAPFGESVLKLLDRALQLYKVNLAIIVSILLLRLIPFLDTSAITTFVDRASGATFALVPSTHMRLENLATHVILLQVGPHQTQVLGLYVVLMLFSPLVLWMMRTGRTSWLLALSWAVYTVNALHPMRVTGAQFEWAFPLLTWQVLFVHGMAVGYHRRRIAEVARGRAGPVLLGAAVAVFLALAFLAQNTPNRLVPAYARLDIIPAQTFRWIYAHFGQKNTLGLLRLLDDAAVMIVSYALLSRLWTPLSKAFGWFFIPLGQASLYVFILHLYVVMLASNVVSFGLVPDRPTHIWRNTLVHLVCMAALWLCVRFKVLYRWIPR
jgi:hypothetical protein